MDAPAARRPGRPAIWPTWPPMKLSGASWQNSASGRLRRDRARRSGRMVAGWRVLLSGPADRPLSCRCSVAGRSRCGRRRFLGARSLPARVLRVASGPGPRSVSGGWSGPFQARPFADTGAITSASPSARGTSRRTAPGSAAPPRPSAASPPSPRRPCWPIRSAWPGSPRMRSTRPDHRAGVVVGEQAVLLVPHQVRRPAVRRHDRPAGLAGQVDDGVVHGDAVARRQHQRLGGAQQAASGRAALDVPEQPHRPADAQLVCPALAGGRASARCRRTPAAGCPSGCSSTGSASTSRSTPAACSSGPTNRIIRSSGPTPKPILTCPKSSGALPLVGQPAFHREGVDAPGVQPQLGDGPVAQPGRRQHAAPAPGRPRCSVCSICRDSSSAGAVAARVASIERSDSTVGRWPSQAPSAGHPLVQVDQVEGRQLGQPRPRRRGRTTGPARAASRPSTPFERMVGDAVLTSRSSAAPRWRDEDVDLVPVRRLAHRQLGDEVGQRPLLPGRPRGERQGGDPQRWRRLRPAALAQIVLRLPDVADLLDPARRGHQQGGASCRAARRRIRRRRAPPASGRPG